MRTWSLPWLLHIIISHPIFNSSHSYFLLQSIFILHNCIYIRRVGGGGSKEIWGRAFVVGIIVFEPGSSLWEIIVEALISYNRMNGVWHTVKPDCERWSWHLDRGELLVKFSFILTLSSLSCCFFLHYRSIAYTSCYSTALGGLSLARESKKECETSQISSCLS